MGADKSGFSAALLRWYRRHGRDLPWRGAPTPYHAWVAEVMLQQTRVETVLRYYAPFLERFPTIEALARAELDAVLKAWEGLGYYARCRNLHRSAQRCVALHDGRFPSTIEEATALPGIGRSTAGAVLTFGRGQAHPVLDGNVKRVLARLFALDAPSQAILWDHAATLLASSRDPFDHNQAAMELGALICTPRDPACPHCPVRRWCAAQAAGLQHELPRRTRRAPLPHHHIAVGVVRRRGRLLLVQRPPDGLLGGLWELPGGRRQAHETLEQTVRRTIAGELGLELEVREELAVVEHAFTHFRITLHAFRCVAPRGRATPRTRPACRWVTPAALDDLALPRAARKVLEIVALRLLP